MAVAKILCGTCGAEIRPDAAACPKCGAAVELPVPLLRVVPRVCALCGYKNLHQGELCESCGAKLPLVPGAVQQKAEPVRPAKPPAPKQKNAPPKGRQGKRVDPWQVVSGIAVIVLIVVLVYTLTSKEQPSVQQSQAVPAGAAGSTMAEVEPLQRAVDANPKDAASLLRLANVLHDNGMLPRAADNYRKYLALDPKDPNARVDLGICYDQMALQDTANAPRLFSEAVEEMMQVTREAPDHQPAAFNLGIVNLHMGNLEESNKWFRRAVELNKDSDLGMRAEKILQQHTFSQ